MKSWLTTAACPVPAWLAVKIPGAAAETSRLPPATNSPVSAVRTAIRTAPSGAFEGTWKFAWADPM